MIDKPIMGEDVYLDPLFADGLVGCWLFNEKPDKLGKVYDVSGYGHTGTLVADTIGVPGRFGPALYFDGTDDYVAFGSPSVFTLNRNFTLCAWFQQNTTTDDNSLISHGSGEWYFRADSTNKLAFLESQVANLLVGDTLLGTGWNFGAVTVGSGATATLTLYLNGEPDGTTTTTATFNDGIEQVVVGADIQPGPVYASFFNGSIDSVQIFNRALSAAEIQGLYQDPFWGFRKNESGKNLFINE